MIIAGEKQFRCNFCLRPYSRNTHLECQYCGGIDISSKKEGKSEMTDELPPPTADEINKAFANAYCQIEKEGNSPDCLITMSDHPWYKILTDN